MMNYILFVFVISIRSLYDLEANLVLFLVLWYKEDEV